MTIEIKEVRLLFPAMVVFTQDSEENSVFVYLDQTKRDIVIPDVGGLNVGEFKLAYAEYYNKKNPAPKPPVMPDKEIFNKIDPNSFKGVFNG